MSRTPYRPTSARDIVQRVLSLLARTGTPDQRTDAAAIATLLAQTSLPSERQPEAASFARAEGTNDCET